MSPDKRHSLKLARTRPPSLPTQLLDILRILRINQWIKNLFVLSPLMFSEHMFLPLLLGKTLLAVLAFCFLSSAIYITNDLFDLKADLLHPQKSKRPLASGAISASLARKLAILFLFSGLASAYFVNTPVFLVGSVYLFLNYIYNIYTKKIPVLDVLTIALGFQARIWAGALAIAIAPSVWLQACTFLLTLFLGFTKRRHQISLATPRSLRYQGALARYKTGMLDAIILLCSSLTILSYGLYIFMIHTKENFLRHSLSLSVLFVIYGIFRYLHIIRRKLIGDDLGEIIFRDKPFVICIFSWAFFVFLILYKNKLFP